MTLRLALGATCLMFAIIAQGQVRRPAPRVGRFRPDVPVLLVRAIRAQPNLRYTGEYTVEFHQGPTPIRHQEYITRDGPRYRIDFPENSPFAGQIIVEDRQTRQHYHPVTNEIIQQPPRHGEVWEKIANLATDTRFHLSEEPGEEIAGEKTDQLVVSDKFGNVLQRLFIEPNSGVILKRQIFDSAGAAIGYVEFSRIDLTPKIDPSAFVIRQSGARVITPLIQLQRVSRRLRFPVRALPPSTGFQLESATGKKFAGIQGLVQTYLDGRVRLWVYELKAPVDPRRLSQQARKNEHFYSWHNDGETIVLIGNIPEGTLERLATMMNSGTSSSPSKL